MCGIFGVVGVDQNAPERVLAGLKQLEYRGYDSWGVAFLIDGNDRLFYEKHTGKIGAAQLTSTDKSMSAIGHTRWATHGGVSVENAHPHLDSKQQIALVHNGIIENFQDLKQELIEKGHSFTSETDSEVFVYLLEDYLVDHSLIEAFRLANSRVTGMNAFVVLSLVDNSIVAIRHGSPLALGKGVDSYYLASDSTAMSPHASQVYYLADDELVVIDSDKVQLFDVDSRPKEVDWRALEFKQQDIALGNYPHFMLKEINEQPRILSTLADDLRSAIASYARELNGRLYFVGCGTAFHASLLATYYLSIIAHQEARAICGSEFRYTRDVLGDNSFITFLSQSGETIDLVEHLPFLRERNIEFGAIVNRLGSTLERGSKHKILLGAGPEQCVLATKSFTTKLATLFLLAHALNGTFDVGARELKSIIANIEAVLQPEYVRQWIEPVVDVLYNAEKLFIIGRGPSYPLALEAALKIKEVTYLHAEGFAGGELKHGVIALIEPGTPCMVIAPSGDEFAATISNAIELRSRGATIIGIAENNNSAFDYWIPSSGSGLLSALPGVVAVQLLAYGLALKLGNDPDKPRNLAKSVTVK